MWFQARGLRSRNDARRPLTRSRSGGGRSASPITDLLTTNQTARTLSGAGAFRWAGPHWLSLEHPAAELSTERARERVPGAVGSANGRTGKSMCADSNRTGYSILPAFQDWIP